MLLFNKSKMIYLNMAKETFYKYFYLCFYNNKEYTYSKNIEIPMLTREEARADLCLSMV